MAERFNLKNYLEVRGLKIAYPLPEPINASEAVVEADQLFDDIGGDVEAAPAPTVEV